MEGEKGREDRRDGSRGRDRREEGGREGWRERKGGREDRKWKETDSVRSKGRPSS